MQDTSPLAGLLESARSVLGLSRDAVQQILGEDARAVPGDEYGAMKDLTSIENPQVLSGTVYLEDDAAVLVRVDQGDLTELDPEALQAHLGEGPVRLRSRAGKTAHLWVYAEQGVAYSAQGETIHFLEVFTPCTLPEYERRIYRDPGAYIR